MPKHSRQDAPVDESEMNRIVAECRKLSIPLAGSVTDSNDYVTNIFITVLDLLLPEKTVNKALDHYRKNRWDGIRVLTDLETLLDQFPDTEAGNLGVAQNIWGNNYGNRIEWLRGFVKFLRTTGLTTEDDLRTWAHRCDYDRDFKGKVKYLDVAAYQWLRMRMGVDTVKPDTHTTAFVRRVIDHDLDPWGIVAVIEDAAKRLGKKARLLDKAIWDHERGVTRTN